LFALRLWTRTFVRQAIGALLSLSLIATLVGVSLIRPGGTVYTVPQLHHGLTRAPAAWLGRTILVHGVLYLCPPADSCYSPDSLADSIADPRSRSRPIYIPAHVGPASPLLEALRPLPVIGRLAPARVVAALGREGTYRVYISNRSRAACAVAYCNPAYPYDVVLVDAMP